MLAVRTFSATESTGFFNQGVVQGIIRRGCEWVGLVGGLLWLFCEWIFVTAFSLLSLPALEEVDDGGAYAWVRYK